MTEKQSRLCLQFHKEKTAENKNQRRKFETVISTVGCAFGYTYG
jgi:hypothetical protein